MQRRTFLLGSLAAMASASAPGLLQARINEVPRRLSLYHTHTYECLDLVYRPSEGPSARSRQQLNHFLRDFRNDEVETIDPCLFTMLDGLCQRSGNPDGVIEIISAYRSPKTNKMLRKKSKGVARKSLHMQGKALDIRLRGTCTSKLRDQAIAMRLGGVGYYRRSDVIHVDTGPVRCW